MYASQNEKFVLFSLCMQYTSWQDRLQPLKMHRTVQKSLKRWISVCFFLQTLKWTGNLGLGQISTTTSTQVHMILLIIKLTLTTFWLNRSSTWTIFWLNRSSERFRDRSRNVISQLSSTPPPPIQFVITTSSSSKLSSLDICLFFNMGSMWADNVLPKYKDGKSEKFLLESTIQHLSVFDRNTITSTSANKMN